MAERTRSDDHYLIERLRSGDGAAIRLLESWARPVVKARLRAKDVDDALQDTLIGVLHRVTAPGFELRESLRGLVILIAKRRCIDQLRMHRPSEELPPGISDENPDPYQSILEREGSARACWALQQLTETCKQLFLLYYVERMDYQAIANRLGKATSTMRWRMHKCVKEVQRLMNEGWDQRETLVP